MNPSSIPQGNQTGFFGVKVSQPGVNVNSAGADQLLYQNDYTAQTFFGSTGNISFGQFTSQLTGQLTLGMQIIDSNGNSIFEMDGTTWSWFDPTHNYNNNMQVGLLPDGNYGWVISTPGNTVADIYG